MQTTPPVPPAPEAPPAPTAPTVVFLELPVLQQIIADAEGRGRRLGYVEGLEDSARAHATPTPA